MSKPVSIRLPEKTVTELKILAEIIDTKYQPLIREVLQEWIDEQKSAYKKYRHENPL